jgi:hypothetical protein
LRQLAEFIEPTGPPSAPSRLQQVISVIVASAAIIAARQRMPHMGHL